MFGGASDIVLRPVTTCLEGGGCYSSYLIRKEIWAMRMRYRLVGSYNFPNLPTSYVPLLNSVCDDLFVLRAFKPVGRVAFEFVAALLKWHIVFKSVHSLLG